MGISHPAKSTSFAPAARCCAMRGVCCTGRLPHTEQFDVENQRGVRWDHSAGTTRSVSQVGWDGKFALAPHLHPLHPFVPALNDPPGTEGKREGLSTIDGTIELFSVLQPTRIVYARRLSDDRRISGADHLIDVFEPRRCGDFLHACLLLIPGHGISPS